MLKANILIIDDMPDNLRLLRGILAEHRYTVRAFSEGRFGLESARSAPPDLILLDIKMPGMDGYEVCEHLKANERTRDIPVIFISALHEVVNKVKGFEAGGMDYITKPFQAEEVLARVKIHLLLHRLRNHLEELVDERTSELRHAVTETQGLNAQLQQEIVERKRVEEELQTSLREVQRLEGQLQAENMCLREEIRLEHNFEEIIGQSQVLKYVLFHVEQVAQADVAVLISGETGTGKELIARAIHATSLRKARPFFKVNCAVLPGQLIESELFGHEKGAFTGAITQRIGRFELAHKATLFLDEIGELPLELQAKLLRVLQEGEFERLGSSRTQKIDVRVIAASNRNLDVELQAGRFRQDLYYRLNVYPLCVPPLRERPEDIPLLIQAFVQKFSRKFAKQIETIPQRTMDALQRYTWPGNIRELENAIERAVITTRDSVLRIDLPKTATLITEKHKTLEEIERDYILSILEENKWKISGAGGAASILGLPPSTLYSRMYKLGIKRKKSD